MSVRAALLRRSGALPDGRAYLLRPASSGDAEALVSLQDAVAAERRYIVAAPGEWSVLEESLMLDALIADGGLSLVVEVDGGAVGHLAVHRGVEPETAGRGDLAIIVANPLRGMGLGRLLMDTAVEWARAVGLSTLSLSVFTTNDRAIALYRSVGFVEGGLRRVRVPSVDGERDLRLMTLTL